MPSIHARRLHVIHHFRRTFLSGLCFLVFLKRISCDCAELMGTSWFCGGCVGYHSQDHSRIRNRESRQSLDEAIPVHKTYLGDETIPGEKVYIRGLILRRFSPTPSSLPALHHLLHPNILYPCLLSIGPSPAAFTGFSSGTMTTVGTATASSMAAKAPSLRLTTLTSSQIFANIPKPRKRKITTGVSAQNSRYLGQGFLHG